VLESGTVRYTIIRLPLVCRCKYSSILYHFLVIDVDEYCDREIWIRGDLRSLKAIRIP